MEKTPPCIAILPSPGMGHLIPFLELAKRLLLSHNFLITCLIPSIHHPSPPQPQQSVLNSLPHGITYQFLPTVSLKDLEDDVRAEVRVSLTMSRSLSPLREALRSLTTRTRLVALIVDLYGTDAFRLAEEFGIPSYVFFTSNAMALSFCLHLPKLDESMTSLSCTEYRDLPEPVELPGCVPVHGRDLMDPVRDRKNDAYTLFLHHAKRLIAADGILVNTCIDLEPGAVRALQNPGSDGVLSIPPVYPVGPLVRTSRSPENGDPDQCLKWLDEQPEGSVVYISFGSGGTLSHSQVTELALGLELSGERFLLALKPPNDKSPNAAYLNLPGRIGEAFDCEYLPKGFMERTRGRGLVLPAVWAPQIGILGHNSVGGFLTHCGWNSTLESVVAGVPMIAWPLYSEQKMNAVMVTEGMGIALMKPQGRKGLLLVEREEIARVVKDLMMVGNGGEGSSSGVWRRVKELKEAVAGALSENGSSSVALSDFVLHCKNKVQF